MKTEEQSELGNDGQRMLDWTEDDAAFCRRRAQFTWASEEVHRVDRLNISVALKRSKIKLIRRLSRTLHCCWFWITAILANAGQWELAKKKTRDCQSIREWRASSATVWQSRRAFTGCGWRSRRVNSISDANPCARAIWHRPDRHLAFSPADLFSQVCDFWPSDPSQPLTQWRW